MKPALVLFTALAISGGVYSFATAEESHDARVHHYEGKASESIDQAWATLAESIAKTGEVLDSQEPNLEMVHELSYTLESSIDKLIADKAAPANNLEAIDEAIQAVHHASENHEEAKTREWFAKLVKIGTPEAASKEQAAVAKGVYEIVIKDHMFTPNEIHVPAGEKIKLIVHNQDATPEEFESDDFRREKIIAGNSSATILVNPLKPGKYHFFGEFNLDTANGHLIAE